jgi:hypothetical protein
MANYEPMSAQQHLDRGYCCDMGCVYCPYRAPTVYREFTIDDRIETALKSGETVTIESDRYSLKPIVVLAGRVTIKYKTL